MSSLSVIIPAYNEEALLGATIDAIKAALAQSELVDSEIIVADDASTDGTAQLAASMGAQVVATNNRQIAATRNAGAKVAKFDWFLFLDADTILPATSLNAAIAELKSGAAGCGVTKVEFDKPQNVFIRFMSWGILSMVRLMGYAPGCCIFATRNAFDATGGFPEDFYASEELWFCRAVKQEGRFALLKESVLTSARKMDYHSTGRIMWMIMKLSVLGPRALKSRKHLELWYDGQRG